MSDQTYYKNGYDSSISNTHSWRTAENSCNYMLKYIKPTDKILDVGSGPGTITLDLAQYVPHGEIIGIEPTKELIEESLKNQKNHRSSNPINNVKFQEASVYSLPFPDDYFDIVHAHQVVVHLAEPLMALKEMKRVLKPQGYLCCRDGELRSTLIYPQSFEGPLGYYMKKAITEFTCQYAGTRSKELVLATKFDPEKIVNTTSTWCISNRKDREMFANMYIKRLDSFKFEPNDKYDRTQLEEAWSQWAKDDRGIYINLHGEIVAQK